MPEQILLNIVGFLITCLLAAIVYIFKGVKDNIKDMAHEMNDLNKKLVTITTNQEWHYESIRKLQSDVKELQIKIHDNHKGCEI